MKNIFKIFKRDLKRIFTNWVAIVVVIALMIIPSLYALINIKASWDPYSNTSGIKVAVVNEDTGTVYKEKDINIGEELIEKLEDNDKIGWVFPSKEEAENGLLMEEYYATIEIPENFSEDVTTLVEKDIRKPKLKYTVNEKINAIAPKMTDAAVKTVKQQLDDNITKTVTGIIFRLADEIGIDIQDNRPQLRKIMDSTYELDENMPELEAVLNATIDGTVSASELMQKSNELIPVLNDIVDSTNDFLGTSQENLDESQDNFNDVAPVIKDKLSDSEELLDSASVELANLDENTLQESAKKSLIIASDSLKATKKSNDIIQNKLDKIQKFIDKVNKIEIPKPHITEDMENIEEIKKIEKAYRNQVEALEEVQESLKEVSKTIDDISERIDTINDKIVIAVNRIDEQISKFDHGEKVNIQALTDTRILIDDIHELVTKTIENYDVDIINSVNNSFNSVREICDESLNLLEQSRSLLPDVENLLSTFINITDTSNEKLLKLQEKFPDIKNNVHKLSEKFKEIDDKEDIDELLELITNDWTSQSDFVSSPIEIEDNRLFPMPNYGTAATPFYIMLCLWIGGYMLSILVDTEIHDDEFENLKSYEVYFGKMLLFLFLGFFQALIASCGAIFLLKIYAVHPVMFILYVIFVSFVFMIMIYTAVSLFSYGGIVFGIVLLVMQVAGTSGNFPIEVNPAIFQTIFPYLPFTYAISGIRQIIAGIVYSILIKDTIILLGFMISSIILGLLLKTKTNNLLKEFREKIKESDLIA